MKYLLRIAIAATLAAFGGTAFAQNTGSTTANASAEILYPLTLSVVAATINFGNIIPPSGSDGTTGTVTLDRSANITYQYSDMNPGQNHGTIGDATFHVTGEGGYNFTVSTPTVSNYSASPAWGSMILTFPAGTYPTGALTLSNSAPNQGSRDFNVGGQLTMPQSQPTGPYSADVSVTAQYQ